MNPNHGAQQQQPSRQINHNQRQLRKPSHRPLVNLQMQNSAADVTNSHHAETSWDYACLLVLFNTFRQFRSDYRAKVASENWTDDTLCVEVGFGFREGVD